jgi:hypothetical protein
MKIGPMGAELFHANGRTDITKLRVAFHNFANAHKNLFLRYTEEANMVQIAGVMKEKLMRL